MIFKLEVLQDYRLGRWDYLIVHCSATSKLADSNDINNLHLARGWDGNGYHVVITQAGEIQTRDNGYPCRPFNKKGAHVGNCGPGWNARSFGVVLIGGVDDKGEPVDNFPDVQKEALRRVINNFLQAHPNPSCVQVMGHRDLIKLTGAPPKDCPCFDVREFLGQ